MTGRSVIWWTREEDMSFCDHIADGASISSAARAVGKSKWAGISRFNKIKRALGPQAK